MRPAARSGRPAVAGALLIGLAAAACGGRERAPERAEGGAAASATTGRADTGAFRPLAVGDVAPAYGVRTLDGRDVQVGAAGAPVTLLNVWATWCTACREEMGDLAALDREFAPRGLRVLAVSVDQGSDVRVRRFVDEERLPVAVGHDPAGRVQDRFRVVGVPATYLIGRDGRVRWTRVGNVHEGLGAVRTAIAAAIP